MIRYDAIPDERGKTVVESNFILLLDEDVVDTGGISLLTRSVTFTRSS